MLFFGVCSVAHLAREFAETLQRAQPELGITEKDILCTQIAGLCHDLGKNAQYNKFGKSLV